MEPVHSSPKLTYDDYVRLPDDGLRHEIIDGVHYVSPSPETYSAAAGDLLATTLLTGLQVPLTHLLA